MGFWLVLTAVVIASLVTIYGYLRWKRNQAMGALRRRFDTLMNCTGAGVFTEEEIEGLPPCVQRYFRHAIALGTPLGGRVRLQALVQMRLGQDKPWMPMVTDQVLAALKGFVWNARVVGGVMRVSGGDYYCDGVGAVQFWLAGVVPVAKATGPDVARSGRGRLVAEMVWLPSALLPSRGTRWEGIDDDRARAHVTVDGEAFQVDFEFGENGALRSVRLPRWINQGEGGRWAFMPFGAEAEAEATFGGYTTPTRLRVMWWPGAETEFEFFRCTINAAEFR